MINKEKQIKSFVEFASIVRLQHKKMAKYLGRKSSNGTSIAIRESRIKAYQIKVVTDCHRETLKPVFDEDIHIALQTIVLHMPFVPYITYEGIRDKVKRKMRSGRIITNQEAAEFVDYERKEITRAFKLVEGI